MKFTLEDAIAITKPHADKLIAEGRVEKLERALQKIAKLATWNECATAEPQVRPTKADISNSLDFAITTARDALR